MSDLKQELKNLLTTCTEAATRLDDIGSSDPTDEEGQRLALEFVFRKIEESELFAVYTRFYALYFSRFVNSGDDCSAVVYDVISCTMVKGEPLIPDKYRKSTSTYSVNFSQAHIFTEVKDGSELIHPESVYKDEALRNNSRGSFASEVKTIFENWAKRDMHSLIVRHQFKSLTGFLALTLLRLVVKTASQVSNEFRKLEYKNNLTTMTEWTDTSVFEPPCKECLELCQTKLSKSRLKERCIFAVLAMIYIDRLNKGMSDAMLAYIRASVMDDTAWNGLGILSLLWQAETALNVGWRQIMKDSWTDKTSGSWKEICEFMMKYKTKNKIQHFWKWSRIVDHSYLDHYSTIYHRALAIVLSGVLEEVHGTVIWDVKWNQGLFLETTRHANLGREMWTFD